MRDTRADHDTIGATLDIIRSKHHGSGDWRGKGRRGWPLSAPAPQTKPFEYATMESIEAPSAGAAESAALSSPASSSSSSPVSVATTTRSSDLITRPLRIVGERSRARGRGSEGARERGREEGSERDSASASARVRAREVKYGRGCATPLRDERSAQTWHDTPVASVTALLHRSRTALLQAPHPLWPKSLA
eukprot:6192868-Pleurochrysis_carterae.AAC.1